MMSKLTRKDREHYTRRFERLIGYLRTVDDTSLACCVMMHACLENDPSYETLKAKADEVEALFQKKHHGKKVILELCQEVLGRYPEVSSVNQDIEGDPLTRLYELIDTLPPHDRLDDSLESPKSTQGRRQASREQVPNPELAKENPNQNEIETMKAQMQSMIDKLSGASYVEQDMARVCQYLMQNISPKTTQESFHDRYCEIKHHFRIKAGEPKKWQQEKTQVVEWAKQFVGLLPTKQISIPKESADFSHFTRKFVAFSKKCDEYFGLGSMAISMASCLAPGLTLKQWFNHYEKMMKNHAMAAQDRHYDEFLDLCYQVEGFLSSRQPENRNRTRLGV